MARFEPTRSVTDDLSLTWKSAGDDDADPAALPTTSEVHSAAVRTSVIPYLRASLVAPSFGLQAAERHLLDWPLGRDYDVGVRIEGSPSALRIRPLQLLGSLTVFQSASAFC